MTNMIKNQSTNGIKVKGCSVSPAETGPSSILEGCPVLPTGVETVRRILWPSRDPPLIGVPSDTGTHAVQRISWTSWDPPLVSPQTQAPMLSGGSLGHPGILPWCPLRHRPPCCPEDPLDIPGSSLGVPSDTGPHAVRRIPWRFPWTFQDPRPANHSSSKPLRLGGVNTACCIS